MTDVKNESNSSFLAGFVIGGLIGVAIALVFAPQNGSAARASFGNRAVSLNRSVNGTASAATGETVDNHDTDSKDAARRSYERPQIILDEVTGASAPPNKG